MERTKLTVTVEHYSDETPEMLTANVASVLAGGGYTGAEVTIAETATSELEK